MVIFASTYILTDYWLGLMTEEALQLMGNNRKLCTKLTPKQINLGLHPLKQLDVNRANAL